MKNYESLVKKFNFTTIEDKYGAMFTLEEIKEALGLDIKMQEETQVFEISDKIITVDIEKRKISTWIYVDLYDKDDYEYEEEENFVDLDDEEEDLVEWLMLPKVGSVHIVEWWWKKSTYTLFRLDPTHILSKLFSKKLLINYDQGHIIELTTANRSKNNRFKKKKN